MNEENKETTNDGQAITNDPLLNKDQPIGNENTREESSPEKAAVDTPNAKQTTEDMEVHKHPHHVTHKKKWNEYLLEFFMLFLAVFLGFLAEYQLEHKIEKDKEIQFIKSMTSDLQDDIKNLDEVMKADKVAIAQLDTLMDLLNNPGLAKQNGDQLYYVARVGPRHYPFANNSRTFDQLRNSGGFRLIQNAEASNNIMGYYDQFSSVRLLEANYNMEFDNFKRVAAKIFDPAILRKQEGANSEITRGNENPSLRTYDADLLKELAYHVLHMNGSRRSRLGMLANLEKTAGELVIFLQNKYHLE